MKLWHRNAVYVAYFFVTLCLVIVAAVAAVKVTSTLTNMQRLEAETIATTDNLSRVERAVAIESVAHEAKARMARRQAADQQTARVQEAMEEVAAEINAEAAQPAPQPAPVIGFAPQGAVSGAVYTNADLRPWPTLPPSASDVRDARVVIDFPPGSLPDLSMRDAVRSGRCAAYSFVNADGKTVNRLNCPSVVAR